MTMQKNEIFTKIQDILVELFEIDQADIHLEARLYEELDLDSIDAVDLLVHLQNLTDAKFQPDEFKLARTVSDVVDIIFEKINH